MPMPSVDYKYVPAQPVHVIAECENPTGSGDIIAVRPGEVIQVRIAVLVSGTTIFYDIRVDRQSGTTEFVEADVFEDKATAVDEYELRI